jgi:tryptophanyl-tRNA synthetase
MKKRILSGIQPSGDLHIGNYFGALKQFVDLQHEYEGFYMLANLHSLTTVNDGEELRRLTTELAKDFLAAGLDPNKSVIFKQSDVPAHAELSWILSTITTMPYLMRAHSFKDAEAKNKDINVGLFNYPMLMAADILLYNTDVVPVGKDQQQHLEITRDVAQKFNNVYGETFKLPEALILENVAVVPGIDGQKMSKSYGNTIPLFASDDDIKSQVAKIKTDSKGVEEKKDPEEDLVFALHKLFSGDQLSDLERKYREGGMGHKESKDILAENIIKYISPMRERREGISNDEVIKVLEDGAKRANEVAEAKLKDIREKVGLI